MMKFIVEENLVTFKKLEKKILHMCAKQLWR